MKRSTLFGLMLGAAALTACGDSGTEPSSPPPPPPATSGSIRILNEANTAIVGVFISSCTDPSWGNNRLGAGEEIAPGAVRSFTMPAGCYDVKASTGTKSGSWYDRTLTAGGTVSLALPAAANASAAMVAEPAGGTLKTR